MRIDSVSSPSAHCSDRANEVSRSRGKHRGREHDDFDQSVDRCHKPIRDPRPLPADPSVSPARRPPIGPLPVLPYDPGLEGSSGESAEPPAIYPSDPHGDGSGGPRTVLAPPPVCVPLLPEDTLA